MTHMAVSALRPLPALPGRPRVEAGTPDWGARRVVTGAKWRGAWAAAARSSECPWEQAFRWWPGGIGKPAHGGQRLL